MIYVETDIKNNVIKINKKPELLKDFQKINGFLLDHTENIIPSTSHIQGKVAKMKASKEQGIWYEYENDILPKEDIENKLNSLENQVLQVQEYMINKEEQELLTQGGM